MFHPHPHHTSDNPAELHGRRRAAGLRPDLHEAMRMSSPDPDPIPAAKSEPTATIKDPLGDHFSHLTATAAEPVFVTDFTMDDENADRGASATDPADFGPLDHSAQSLSSFTLRCATPPNRVTHPNKRPDPAQGGPGAGAEALLARNHMGRGTLPSPIPFRRPSQSHDVLTLEDVANHGVQDLGIGHAGVAAETCIETCNYGYDSNNYD
ncbi:hypothetical protein BC828DRAFT_375592 [Blastocladiella britannica]|nr:hypothetical protein BC828DRAFT_375592 [Blastocladiella britannica]